MYVCVCIIDIKKARVSFFISMVCIYYIGELHTSNATCVRYGDISCSTHNTL